MEKQLLEMLTDTKLVQVFDGACFPCNLFFLQLCACKSSVCCLFSILYQKWRTYWKSGLFALRHVTCGRKSHKYKWQKPSELLLPKGSATLATVVPHLSALEHCG